MRGTADGLKAWIVAVDMGLGHQRAIYPLAPLAEGGILTLGGPNTGTGQEARLWNRFRNLYEAASRLKSLPLVGGSAFSLVDRLLSIPPYYPRRDLSRPTYQVGIMSTMIGRGLCQSMLSRIRTQPLPLVTSYPAPAIAADRAGHDPIYCIVCDAEVSRAWVPGNPQDSRIHYLAPCERTVLRLRSYGVPPERITLTGFPFPLEVLGDRSLDILRQDLARRLRRLDPAERFWPLHGETVCRFLGTRRGSRDGGPLTITFAVGGAGAQCDLGRQILVSLRDQLRQGAVRLNLVAGVRMEVRTFFEQSIAQVLPDCPNIRILFARTKPEYFRRFSRIIRGTDVLWTKPSELSFYCGLGLPLLVAPPIGSQEVFNRKWLLAVQAGIPQEDPRYTGEWLSDLLNEGRLAEAAWNGFLKVRKHGTYAIRDLLEGGEASLAACRESVPEKLAIA